MTESVIPIQIYTFAEVWLQTHKSQQYKLHLIAEVVASFNSVDCI